MNLTLTDEQGDALFGAIKEAMAALEARCVVWDRVYYGWRCAVCDAKALTGSDIPHGDECWYGRWVKDILAVEKEASDAER